MTWPIWISMLTAGWLSADAPELVPGPTAAATFREQVVPLLERRCVSCHSRDLAKGGLALDTRDAALRGGESGASIDPGDPAASLLIDYVSGDKPEMPRNGSPLTPAEVAALREWIAAGAHWPEGLVLHERPQADTDWWSLRPLSRPAVPSDGAPSRSTHPVDRFIAAELARHQLEPSPRADRRTLIRRVYFDLIGLPPTPEEIHEFVNDPAPDAYEQLVDRLLASPHYGERWARHWLDVVHYGETHGYDKDKPRPHAWPYRDYVIRAFNDDKPYAQFVREQLAGDVIETNPAEGIPALGFIAAGPWDYIGHAEVPESKTDGKIARNLDRDDMVVNTLNSFCSLTVQCARCHAHKFDPVSQTDYYRLQSVFAALDRADRPFDADSQIHRRRQELAQQIRTAEAQQQQVQNEIAAQAGPRLKEIEQRVAALRQQKSTGFQAPPEHGYHSRIEPRADVEKWVQVDLGQKTAIAQVVLRACHDDFNQIGSGFGFPPRYRVDVSLDPEFSENVTCIADHSAQDEPNPGLTPRSFPVGGLMARYVRVTATRLATRQQDYILALSELEVFDDQDSNRARGATVTALDSIEAPIRWRRSNLVDGIFPQSPAAAPTTELATLERERSELLQERVADELLQQRDQISTQLAKLQADIAALPAPQRVYAGTIHHGSGAFRGTGPDGGLPRPIHLLHRGDVGKPGDLVEPGVPPLVPGWSGTFELPAGHDESSRRAALAEWIVDNRNPLTWRSIVNRVWQYHFGRGLVDSSNDFGRMGQLPTHPELLDWLAVEFRDGGQSLKRLHRLLLTSATYQQASTDRTEALAIDADNARLWRANRRKLDAEAIRDSFLLLSGRLNRQLGGPSFQDFVVERPEHSPHYEYRLHDPDDPRTHRRSVYRFLVRSQPQPFMTTLDCADPSMSVDKRNESINALQALALLNNGLTMVAARDFAGRLETAAPDLPAQLELGMEMAIGRPPTAVERDVLLTYAVTHGLANTCRVILNLNEFTFID